MKKGLFITLEGGEGAGKSTLMLNLEKKLIQKGYQVVKTREPGGSPLGEQIRGWLLSHNDKVKIGSYAELLLFLAARAQHIEELIAPAIKEGKIVLCDRFNDSTIAYQSGARGLDSPIVKQLCDLVSGPYQPDLTFLLDIDPTKGLARTKNRSSSGADRIEAEALHFHHRVREAFLKLAKEEPTRIFLLDAGKPQVEVFNEAMAHLEKFLK